MVGLAHNFMRLLGPMSILTLATNLWPRHTMSQSRRYSRQPYAYKLKIYFPKVLRSCLCYCLCFSSLMIKKNNSPQGQILDLFHLCPSLPFLSSGHRLWSCFSFHHSSLNRIPKIVVSVWEQPFPFLM